MENCEGRRGNKELQVWREKETLDCCKREQNSYCLKGKYNNHFSAFF